ncbi:keratinocyte-associated protein 2 [Bombyx mori]|uniref:Keratinocyte-associated protein 2 n=1 Tax=Bombyx mori TaxID=7091 RepID=Q2F5Z2_BOMMO|nr:keratinocyte-associated protein 2 [Bombyx mori]ABD36225.1 keratinocyte-associated protein 2 [Bombyx mori]
MAVNSATSFVLSSILTLLIFSGMQMYKPQLILSPMTIIFGGYLGSLMFMFFVTAVGNLETILFGKAFQLKLPEVVLSMGISLIAAGMVHRICFTTCLIFCVITIYYMNKLSQKKYAVVAPQPAAVKSRRHK